MAARRSGGAAPEGATREGVEAQVVAKQELLRVRRRDVLRLILRLARLPLRFEEGVVVLPVLLGGLDRGGWQL